MKHLGLLFSLALIATVVVGGCILRMTASVTIEGSQIDQKIDGFGASSADFVKPLSPEQANFFFTTAGIGLTILRVQLIPDRMTCNAEFQNGGCSAANGQILDGELRTAQLAVARGAIVIATPWSPPAAFKTNGSFKNGGSLLPARYADWASQMAEFVVMMRSNGVPIYAVSIQNEPDIKTAYGSCLYTAQQIHDFVPYLHRALESAGVGATKIMIAEESGWRFDLASSALGDANVSPDVGIVAAHGYNNGFHPFPLKTVPLWQSEDSSQSPVYEGGIKDGVQWAHTIHRFLSVGSINAWLWWFLSDMPGQGEGTDNAALTDISGNIPKRAYVTGQWSRFVRPGWFRVEAACSGRPEITAFKEPQGGAFAIVAVNRLPLPIRTVFLLKGLTAASVVPWITSRSCSLAAQPRVGVYGSKFVYTLPARSVTTFSGGADDHHVR